MEKPINCPQSNHPMKEKQKRDGSGSFWGCSGYPACKFIWRDELAPPRTFTPRPAKTEQIKQMQETKAGFIKVAQDNKNDNIRLSSAARDATILITTFFPKLDSPEVIRKTWLTWREWLYNRMGEVPQHDTEPFPTYKNRDVEVSTDDWPPEPYK